MSLENRVFMSDFATTSGVYTLRPSPLQEEGIQKGKAGIIVLFSFAVVDSIILSG